MIRLKPNDKICSEEGGREFTVEGLIHSGSGQGDIYKVRAGKEIYALKLFHTGDPKRIRRQIGYIKRRGRASAAFVHPLYTVKVGDRIGYVMEYVGGEHYANGSILFNGVERDVGGGNTVRVELPFHQKLAILYNVAEAESILYDAGIVFGDWKFENIKVNLNDFSVKILDTDTAVGGRSKPIVSGTVGFMEPRVMRGEILPDKYSDAFSLAVMIFMSLISGHPLRGRRYEEPCNTDIDTYTFATNPVYIFDRKDSSNRPLESDKRVIERMKNYPKYFHDAMHETFSDGLFDGTKRVEPREWCELLIRLYGDYFQCRQCGEEYFFGTAAKTCYICGSPIEPPLKLVCEKSGAPGVHLFNGTEIWSEELLGEENSCLLFRVVVSEYDRKFGLYCAGANEVELELRNGLRKRFERGEVLPIFLDATLKVGNHTLKFTGGHTK